MIEKILDKEGNLIAYRSHIYKEDYGKIIQNTINKMEQTKNHMRNPKKYEHKIVGCQVTQFRASMNNLIYSYIDEAGNNYPKNMIEKGQDWFEVKDTPNPKCKFVQADVPSAAQHMVSHFQDSRIAICIIDPNKNQMEMLGDIVEGKQLIDAEILKGKEFETITINENGFSEEDMIKFAKFCSKLPGYTVKDLISLYKLNVNQDGVEEPENSRISGKPLLRTVDRIAKWATTVKDTKPQNWCILIENPTEEQIKLVGAYNPYYPSNKNTWCDASVFQMLDEYLDRKHERGLRISDFLKAFKEKHNIK